MLARPPPTLAEVHVLMRGSIHPLTFPTGTLPVSRKLPEIPLRLLVFLPVAIVAEIMHALAMVVFVLSAIAIIPLSGILGTATEELAGHTGATVGGLINATLGIFAELVIATIALRAGLVDLVKASITGSILGNLLLVLGAAQLAGGLKYKSQRINRNLTNMSSTLLVVAVLGLVMPAVLHAVHPDPLRPTTQAMSVWVAVTLIAGSEMPLLYSTYYRAIFCEGGDVAQHETPPKWHSGSQSSCCCNRCGDWGAVGDTRRFDRRSGEVDGIVAIFVGLILIPIIGNAAEHSSAVLMALKNRMDLAVSISVGSAIQVALLVGPLLVLLGLLFGQPMDLAFTLMEVASVAVAVAVALLLCRIPSRTGWKVRSCSWRSRSSAWPSSTIERVETIPMSPTMSAPAIILFSSGASPLRRPSGVARPTGIAPARRELERRADGPFPSRTAASRGVRREGRRELGAGSLRPPEKGLLHRLRTRAGPHAGVRVLFQAAAGCQRRALVGPRVEHHETRPSAEGKGPSARCSSSRRAGAMPVGRATPEGSSAAETRRRKTELSPVPTWSGSSVLSQRAQ